jgi:flagellar P-ring protein precursor FlgI
MKRIFSALLIVFTVSAVHTPVFAQVTVKVREVVSIDGLKENQVFGFGLVVGLQGSGDTKNIPVTNASLSNLLRSMGMEGSALASKNSAAVLLTANLAPYTQMGERVDITVSSIGDAKSLEGGILIQSVLRGGDNQNYVAAQGPLVLSKPAGGGKAVKTVARIAGGGIVEREIIPVPVNDKKIFLVLKNWDYTVADAVMKAVKEKYTESEPVLTEAGKIQITLSETVPLAEYISAIENLEVAPASRGMVVIYEKDATVAAGGEIKISEAMVSREGITVEVGDSGKKGSSHHIKEGATVKELVDAMNATGASTNDIILILKALKDAGALHAELIVR